MKNSLLLLLFISAFIVSANAQSSNIDTTLYEKGLSYMYSGDLDNAVLVLGNAAKQEPGKYEIQKDLEFCYYLKRDYSKAIELGKKLLNMPDADYTAYQVLGLSYMAIAEYKECEKLYKAGIKKYPNIGVLYNEMGNLFGAQSKFEEAIKWWEKGIEMDPNYSGNYYNAAGYYDKTANYLWAAIYGEIFINLESYSPRTAKMKAILLDNYKFLFSEPQILAKDTKSGSNFAKLVATILSKYQSLTTSGVTIESLTSVRTSFILDWFEHNAEKYPSRLFDHIRQMVQDGTINAYDHWVFSSDADEYKTWAGNNAKENDEFQKLLKNRIFKIPSEGQYYRY